MGAHYVSIAQQLMQRLRTAQTRSLIGRVCAEGAQTAVLALKQRHAGTTAVTDDYDDVASVACDAAAVDAAS